MRKESKAILMWQEKVKLAYSQTTEDMVLQIKFPNESTKLITASKLIQQSYKMKYQYSKIYFIWLH